MASSQAFRTAQMEEFESFITGEDKSEKRARIRVLRDVAYKKAKAGDFKSLELLLGWAQGKPMVASEIVHKQELTGDEMAQLASQVRAELGADGKPRLRLVEGSE